MQKCTKQVVTIGPASEKVEQLIELLQAGMNVARFNTKHNVPEWHLERMKRVKEAAQKSGIPAQILLDLQGPEVRITLPSGKEFALEKGQEMIFTAEASANAHHEAVIPEEVIASLKIGNQILLADGSCELEVTHKSDSTLTAKALEACVVKDRKTMNTPGIVLEMPALTEKDLTYLDGLKDFQIEFVGLSFVRSATDILHLRKELDKRNLHAAIIAKIENQAAIENMDAIIEVSDGIMVARGDLGVELPFEEVPFWQKELVKKCRAAQKPVITATQMLLSMVSSPRPTRSEVSDVANAVYDGTDAVMLSEESAQGKWPVKVVATQAKIARFYEQKEVARHKGQEDELAPPLQKLMTYLRAHKNEVDAIAIYGANRKQLIQLSALRLAQPLVFISDELTHPVLQLLYGVHYVNAKSPTEVGQKIVAQRILTSGEKLLILVIGNWENQQQQSLSILKV